jgi:hypothetical protein
LVIGERVRLLTSTLLSEGGGKANQDVRERLDCQAERLATMGLKFSGFPDSTCANVMVRLVQFT